MIYYEHFKHIPDNTLSDITKLFNEVLLQGSLPLDWKKNVTIPIYKSGDPLSSSNYRPITLAPVLYKLFISILDTCLSSLFETFDLIFPFQNGFCKGRSVYNNLYHLLEVITQSKNTGSPIALAYLDIQKCYDSIEHWLINETFSKYGFNDSITKLISNIYLNNTTQISTPYGLTEEIHITRGVKQGCPMSPLIFILLSNPLLWWIHESSTGLPIITDCITNKLTSLAFADDMTLLASSITELQSMISKVEKFNSRNGLALSIETNISNPSKTVYTTNIPGPHSISITQSTQIFQVLCISPQTSYKYLGMWINLDLNFDKQMKIIQELVTRFINHIKNRCYSTRQIADIVNKVMVPSIIYRSCFLPLSTSFLDSLNKKIAKVIYHKLYLPGWNCTSHIELPEAFGGFGISDLVALSYVQRVRILNQLINSSDIITSNVVPFCAQYPTTFSHQVFQSALIEVDAKLIKCPSPTFQRIQPC